MTDNIKVIERNIVYKTLELSELSTWSIETAKDACHELQLDDAYLKLLFENDINIITRQFAEYNLEELENIIHIHPEFGTLRSHQKLGFLLKEYFRIILIRKNIISKIRNYVFVTAYNVSDRIWKLAGDKDLNFSYYSKRMILASIYIKTFLYAVSSDSIEIDSLSLFIERRISDVLKMGKFVKTIKTTNILSKIPFVRLLVK